MYENVDENENNNDDVDVNDNIATELLFRVKSCDAAVIVSSTRLCYLFLRLK